MNVFICLTPLHFYFAYCIADTLYIKEKSRSLIVVKGAYCFEGSSDRAHIAVTYIRNSSFLEKIMVRLQYGLFWRFTKIRKTIIRRMKRLYVFNFNDPVTQNAIDSANESVEVIYTEEGIGSWSHKWTGSIAPDRVNIALMGEPEMYKKIHPEFKGEVRRLVYSEILNPRMALEFNKFITKETIPDTARYLYLGIRDGELITSDEEIQLLEKIIALLPDDVSLYIKKHPRDDSDKYDRFQNKHTRAIILSDKLKEVPVECLIWTSNVSCIISIFSSAGYYLSKIKSDMKTVFLYKLDTLPELGLTDAYKFTTEDYKRFENLLRIQKNAHSPSTISELKELLNINEEQI